MTYPFSWSQRTAGPSLEESGITELQPDQLPSSLDRYLRQSESRWPQLISGTEKKIFWAGKPDVQTPLSVVYLHGFSATRQETAPLANQVAAQIDANLFYTRFTGHGLNTQAMADCSLAAWLKDTWEAFAIGQRLGQKVIIIGNSTGATAATWLAAKQKIQGLLEATILLAPNFAPVDKRAWLFTLPYGLELAERIAGKNRVLTPQNPLHKKYWSTTHPLKSLVPMMQLIEKTNLLDLSTIKTPTLVLYSPKDTIVSAKAIEKNFSRIGAKRKQLVAFDTSEDPSQHILAGDAFSPGTTPILATMIVNFIQNQH